MIEPHAVSSVKLEITTGCAPCDKGWPLSDGWHVRSGPVEGTEGGAAIRCSRRVTARLRCGACGALVMDSFGPSPADLRLPTPRWRHHVDSALDLLPPEWWPGLFAADLFPQETSEPAALLDTDRLLEG